MRRCLLVIKGDSWVLVEVCTLMSAFLVVLCESCWDDRKFFERIILCNSLVWTCEFTGQSGLTYQEAVEADRRASSRLADFPVALRCPLLLLMQLTRRRKLTDARDDIYSFVAEHFFVDEEVMATISPQNRSVCVYICVCVCLLRACMFVWTHVFSRFIIICPWLH